MIGIAGNDNSLSTGGISSDVPAWLLSGDEVRKYGLKLELMRCTQISKIDSLNLRNTWISFLNVSLKMHADVIAGRQINQTLNEISKKVFEKICKPTM